MALLGPVFLDSSILVAGLIDFGDGSGQDDPQRVLDAVVAGRVPKGQTAWHCCLEFYSVATRLPAEYRLTPEAARRLLDSVVFRDLEVHGLPAARRKALLDDCISDRVVGGRVYGRHIGAVAVAADARILVTENGRHFASLLRQGVEVLSAREFLDRLS